MAHLHDLAGRVRAAWQARGAPAKAVSFGLIGVINAAVDYGAFFVALAALGAGARAWGIVAANVAAWFVAVSGSYVMNALVTFARESGGKLRWRAYLTFAAAGIAGLAANTATVLVLAQTVPLWAAKLAAILAGFAVNFLLAHLVVFRPGRPGPPPGG